MKKIKLNKEVITSLESNQIQGGVLPCSMDFACNSELTNCTETQGPTFTTKTIFTITIIDRTMGMSCGINSVQMC